MTLTVELGFIRERTKGLYNENLGRTPFPQDLVLPMFYASQREVAIYAGFGRSFRLNFDDQFWIAGQSETSPQDSTETVRVTPVSLRKRKAEGGRSKPPCARFV